MVYVAVLLLVGGLVGPVGAAGDTFGDDDGSTHEVNIELVADAGITQGCGNGLFCPDDPVTRGQMASFVVRALGYVDDGGGDLFSDDDGSPHEANIDLLAGAGVTLGCGTGLFCPGDPVTRGQMASFIARAFHYDQASASDDYFSDDDGSIHEANINLLFEAGVTQGCSTGPTSFCPNDPVTRGQMASFLARALKLPWPADQSDDPDVLPEGGDSLGNAVEIGDFNGDGWGDLALGDWREDGDEGGDGGAVRVIYGTAGGPTGPTQFLNDPSFGRTPQINALFGRLLAVGDFDDDGYDDLAIAVTDPAGGNFWRVLLAVGGPSGLTPSDEIYVVPTNTSNIDALVAGQFGNGSADDLAIGLSRATANGVFSAGLVEVIYGSPTGFSAPVQYHQDTPGVSGVAEFQDLFAASLAAGDLTGDGFDELVVGVALEDLNTALDENDVGVIHVFYGSDSGLEVDRAGSPEIIHQADLGAENEEGDRFGSSIVIGDFTGDGIGDLIVGVPGEGLETPVAVSGRGNVTIVPGGANGPVESAAFDFDSVAGAEQPLDSNELGKLLGFVPGQRPALVVPRSVAKDPDGGVFLLRPDALEDLETGPFGLDFDTYDSIASGDIDGDGILDLAIGSTGLALVDDPSVTFVGGVAVWLGQADGSFKPWPGGLIQ